MPPLGAGASFAYFRLEGVGVAVQTRLDGLLPVLLVRQVVVAVGTVAVVAKLSIGKAVAVTTGKKKFSYGKKKFSYGKKKFSYGKKKFSYGKTQVQCTIASKINVTPKVFICPFRSHTRF